MLVISSFLLFWVSWLVILFNNKESNLVTCYESDDLLLTFFYENEKWYESTVNSITIVDQKLSSVSGSFIFNIFYRLRKWFREVNIGGEKINKCKYNVPDI